MSEQAEFARHNCIDGQDETAKRRIAEALSDDTGPPVRPAGRKAVTSLAAANRHHARDPQRTLKLLQAA